MVDWFTFLDINQLSNHEKQYVQSSGASHVAGRLSGGQPVWAAECISASSPLWRAAFIPTICRDLAIFRQ
jgi:hypothetical protein